MKIKTDIDGMVKDSHSKAVLNNDREALKAYKARKKRIKQQENLANRMRKLEDDVSEIKSLLQQLIKK